MNSLDVTECNTGSLDLEIFLYNRKSLLIKLPHLSTLDDDKYTHASFYMFSAHCEWKKGWLS